MRSIRNYKKRKCSLRKRKINKRKYKKSKRLIKKRKFSKKRKFIGGSAAEKEQEINTVWVHYRKDENDKQILFLLRKILQDALDRSKQVPNESQSKYLSQAKLSNLLQNQKNTDTEKIITFLKNIGWKMRIKSNTSSYFLQYPLSDTLNLYLDKLNEMLIINIINIKATCNICGEQEILKNCKQLLQYSSDTVCDKSICQSCFNGMKDAAQPYDDFQPVNPPTIKGINEILGVYRNWDKKWGSLTDNEKGLVIQQFGAGSTEYTVIPKNVGGKEVLIATAKVEHKINLICPFCRKNWKDSFD